MKNIFGGAAAGGVWGVLLDVAINDKDDHSYLSSAAIGGLAGGGAAALLRSKRSGATNPITAQAPAQAPVQAPKDEIKPVALKATKTKKQQNQKRNQKTRQRQIRNIKSKLSKASNVLNKEINLPTLNFQPMTNALNGIAESSKETIGTASNLIKNKSGQIASSIKKISATAKERITRPIQINLPRIDVSLPRIPTSITNAVANGKKAIPGYLKSGLLATAAMAVGHIPMQGPAFNPVAKITHAQSSMNSSQMTKPLISSISESAQQTGSALKPVTPKTLETSIPQQIARQDTESLIKNPLEEVFKSFGATKKEKIIQHGLDKNKSLGDKMYKSSNLDDLYPDVKEKAELFIKKAKEQGLNLKIFETFRNFNQQDKYFKQGRTTPGSIITNAKSGEGLHSYGLALDVYPVVNGKPLMTVDGPNKKYWDKMGEIAESVGFEWGGRWKFKDYPHIEISHGVSLNDMRASRVSMLDQEGKDKWFAEKIGDQQGRLAKEKDPKKIEEITKSISDVKKIRGF